MPPRPNHLMASHHHGVRETLARRATLWTGSSTRPHARLNANNHADMLQDAATNGHLHSRFDFVLGTLLVHNAQKGASSHCFRDISIHCFKLVG
jgi:hypothetical protein